MSVVPLYECLWISYPYVASRRIRPTKGPHDLSRNSLGSRPKAISAISIMHEVPVCRGTSLI